MQLEFELSHYYGQHNSYYATGTLPTVIFWMSNSVIDDNDFVD